MVSIILFHMVSEMGCINSAMATGFRLEPPHPFDFKVPDGWDKWKRRYLQYQDASGLSGEPEVRQVSSLLYCLGEEANDVLASTNITEENAN